ncbi:MAG: ATP-binding cassette domain-containing protein [Patescibacteria group bacterium]
MEIKFDRTSKHFGSVSALEEVSFEIASGEFVFITGKSGAGKSTVISLILGEFLPSQGRISLNDVCLAESKKSELLAMRRRMGIIYQDFRLLNNRTVRENILLALDVVGHQDEDWAEQLDKVLSLVGLQERLDFFPSQLSGGELQRVCLARALIIKPELLIADEPTGNLDPETGWELMDLLKKINQQGTTVIMTTHNFDIVNSMKQRVIKLDAGRLVSDKKEGKYE